MRVAFKEWAKVVDALGRGEQILILRKGGIHEGLNGFRPEHPVFFLFPTLFHQQQEGVIPKAQNRFAEIRSALAEDVVRLEYFAEIAEVKRLETLEAALALEGQHIWSEETIKKRFEWGRDASIYAIAVRVYQLRHVVEILMTPEYKGCKSWVTLPQSIDTTGAKPVLDDAGFQRKLGRFLSVVEDNPVLPLS